MEKANTPPTGERILSLLVDLLADQHGVKVKYQIIKKEERSKTNGSKSDT